MRTKEHNSKNNRINLDEILPDSFSFKGKKEYFKIIDSANTKIENEIDKLNIPISYRESAHESKFTRLINITESLKVNNNCQNKENEIKAFIYKNKINGLKNTFKNKKLKYSLNIILTFILLILAVFATYSKNIKPKPKSIEYHDFIKKNYTKSNNISLNIVCSFIKQKNNRKKATAKVSLNKKHEQFSFFYAEFTAPNLNNNPNTYNFYTIDNNIFLYPNKNSTKANSSIKIIDKISYPMDQIINLKIYEVIYDSDKIHKIPKLTIPL